MDQDPQVTHSAWSRHKITLVYWWLARSILWFCCLSLLSYIWTFSIIDGGSSKVLKFTRMLKQICKDKCVLYVYFTHCIKINILCQIQEYLQYSTEYISKTKTKNATHFIDHNFWTTQSINTSWICCSKTSKTVCLPKFETQLAK